MRITESKIREIIRETINELGAFSTPSYTSLTGGNYPKSKSNKGSSDVDHYQGYSSKEAKNVVDNGLKNWAKDLRKVQGRVVKDWLSGAKRGQIDFFDIVRGLRTGDIRRAHPYETDFLAKLLSRDKISNRFRSYFKGKKGKGSRRK